MLFGRARELDSLDGMLSAAASGRGSLRVLSGEAGIGKTRLADETAARATARGFAIAWGRAWETGGAPSYWPWVEILRAVAPPATELPPQLAAIVGAGATSTADDGGDQTRADPARERFELFESVSFVLRERAKTAPLLLVLDDLHAADLASLELLSFVARGVRASPIAILGTWRDAESRLPPVADVLARIAREGEVHGLRPLTSEEVAELVRHELGRFDVAIADALFDLTEGNPLFAREALHAVVIRRQEAPLEALRDAVASGGVLALVRSRSAGAGEDARAVLAHAATLGRDVELPILADVTGRPLEAIRRELDAASARGLLVSRGETRWTFAHVLVREAFYRELDASERAAIHARCAAAFRVRVDRGEEEHIATLAHHALAALPNGDPVEVARIARRAAARARAQLAYDEAIAILDRALAACEAHDVDAHEWTETAIALGWACTEAGQLERGRSMFHRAAASARRLGDARLLARAALGQGGQYVLGETRDELIDVLREALEAIGGPRDVEDRRLRARLLARLAAALTPSETPEEPLALAAQALEMVRDETDLHVRIDVAVAAGSTLTDHSPPALRIAVNEQLLADARAVGDRVLRLRALMRLSCDHLQAGDMAAADAAIGALEALSGSLGHPRYCWQTPLVRSMRAMPDGRFDDCEAAIAEARAIAREALDPNTDRCIELHRFFMLLFAGRTDELRAQEARALEATERLLGPGAFRWISTVVDARLGERGRAARALETLGPSPHLTARMSRVQIAEAALLAGTLSVAERMAATFSKDDDSIASWGPFAFSCSPPVARTLGAVAFAAGRADEGAAHLERASELAARVTAPPYRAWVDLAWGEALRGTEARPYLDRAAELGEKLGMPEIVRRARDAAAESASHPSPRPGPTAAPRFTLRRDGKRWHIESGERVFHVKDVRGMSMLAMLVARPHEEVHAIDLVTGGEGIPDGGDAGEVIDARARKQYEARIAELRREIDEADAGADLGRASRLRYELDALTDQVAAAVGLGGRMRRVGSAAERARITAQRRIREAIKRIADEDPELGRHLDWTIRTGTFCAYEPRGRGT